MSRQNEKKKKQREQLSKKRVVARRKQLRDLTKKDREQARLERKYRKRQQPIVNTEFVPPARSLEPSKVRHSETTAPIRSKLIKDRLQRNMEILEALKEEADKEQKSREELQQSIPGDTLKEKMDYIHEQATKDIPPEEIAGNNS